MGSREQWLERTGRLAALDGARRFAWPLRDGVVVTIDFRGLPHGAAAVDALYWRDLRDVLDLVLGIHERTEIPRTDDAVAGTDG